MISIEERDELSVLFTAAQKIADFASTETDDMAAAKTALLIAAEGLDKMIMAKVSLAYMEQIITKSLK